MSYVARPPIYEAIRWDGTNVEECRAFYETWFPQPAPPPPGYEAPPNFQYDADAATLTIAPGYMLQVGDWMVNGGTRPPDLSWAGSPEVVQDAAFALKYAEQQ